MRAARFANAELALELALAVHGKWLTRIIFSPGPVAHPTEDVVRRELNEGHPVPARPMRDSRGGLGIDTKGKFNLIFCPIDRGISRRIDDQRRLKSIEAFYERIRIREIEIRPRRCQYLSPAAENLLKSVSNLPGRSCDQDAHHS